MNAKMVRAATALLVSGGVGLTGLGLAAGTARAEPIPAPMYHWCPGDFWDPGWGGNWDWDDCHDDFHRDSDRDWHPDWNHDHDRGPWQPWWPH